MPKLECNAIEEFAKSKNPYKNKCCPNMKREAKKWAKIKHKGKTVCVKTCCNNCITAIQNGLKKGDKYEIKKDILYKKSGGEWRGVFKTQTLSQVKKNDPGAEFRN